MLLYVQKLNPAHYVEEHSLWTNGAGVGNTQVRAEGWHAGEIIREIGIALGEKTWEKSKALDLERGGFQWNWKHHLGLAWETYMVKRTPAIWQSGEIYVSTGLEGTSPDGRDLGRIYLNPDGYTPEDTWLAGTGTKLVPILEEFKLTDKSSNHPPETFWYWLMQMKIYLAGLEELFGQEHRWARLWVCHARGGYRDGDDREQAYCWWVEFTRAEIEDNRKVMVKWLDEQRAR